MRAPGLPVPSISPPCGSQPPTKAAGTPTHTYTHVQKHAHTYAQTRVQECMYAQTREDIYSLTLALRISEMHACTCTCTRTHTHTHKHKHTHTYARVYVHHLILEKWAKYLHG